MYKRQVERHAADFGSDYAIDEAIFTTGGKLALFNAVQILVEHGDEVILPVPYWVDVYKRQVFGRYPVEPDGNRYPVLDLVLCHGSFLNADNTYVHKNKSFRGFGSYGDILVRDRKMYVAPTPFALTDGTAHRRTIILPESEAVDANMTEVGTLVRTEVESVVTAYQFDLKTNELQTTLVPNPNAGTQHIFKAYRLEGDSLDPVTLRDRTRVTAELAAAETEQEEE